MKRRKIIYLFKLKRQLVRNSNRKDSRKSENQKRLKGLVVWFVIGANDNEVRGGKKSEG